MFIIQLKLIKWILTYKQKKISKLFKEANKIHHQIYQLKKII